MSLTSARATLYSILLMITTAAAAIAESPEPINPNAVAVETTTLSISPDDQDWTLILNVYGYKYGGPTRMPNLSQRVCTGLMEKMNAKDVRSIRRATGDEDGIRGANAIACINTHTAEIIWP